MRRKCLIFALGALLSMPAAAVALLLTVDGNKPQSPENYKRWPGLVDVVNQPSRQMLVWCNGNEWLGYRGDTAALNATLAAYSRSECPVRRVVLRPGPAHKKYDWMLHVTPRVSQAIEEHPGLRNLHLLDPYLEVYVSDRLELLSLEVPANVEVLQLSDLRTRYEAVLSDANADVRRAAEQALESLNRDLIRGDIGAEQYDELLRRIQICAKTWARPAA